MDMHGNGETHTVPLRGGEIRCVVRRRKNQKYINLRITLEGELLVSAPYGVSIQKIAEALRQKEKWIESNLLKVAAGRTKNDPLHSVSLAGVPYEVQIVRDPRRRRLVRVNASDRTLEIRTDDISEEHVLSILQRHLEREARRAFSERTQTISRAIGIDYSRLFIRNQRTRWGSSSGRGNISLNWRAIMLPHAVQDYLIIHELAHQVHLNHSKAFWSLVEKHCPDYRSANRWLKNHSLLISLFR